MKGEADASSQKPKDQVTELTERVSKLENIAKIVGGVALVMGVSGGALWKSISDERRQLASHAERLENQLRETAGALKSKMENDVAQLQIVRYGDPVSIRDKNQPAVVITRHGDGGAYLSPYPDNKVGLGVNGSATWILTSERKDDSR